MAWKLSKRRLAVNRRSSCTDLYEQEVDVQVIETEKKLSDKEAAAEYEAHRRRMELPEFRNSHNVRRSFCLTSPDVHRSA